MLYLIRGLPGSGKSTHAAKLRDKLGLLDCLASADDFMPYPNFDPKLLPSCHKKCQDRVSHLLEHYGHAIVHNTFTQRWEMNIYYGIALDVSVKVEEISLFDAGLSDAELAARNVHNVPIEAIARMRACWEV